MRVLFFKKKSANINPAMTKARDKLKAMLLTPKPPPLASSETAKGDGEELMLNSLSHIVQFATNVIHPPTQTLYRIVNTPLAVTTFFRAMFRCLTSRKWPPIPLCATRRKMMW